MKDTRRLSDATEVKAALILPHGLAVVVQLRSDDAPVNPGKWSFFGGQRLEGESLEACVARHVKEKLGVIICESTVAAMTAYPALKDPTETAAFCVAWVEPEELHDARLKQGKDWKVMDTADYMHLRDEEVVLEHRDLFLDYMQTFNAAKFD